MNDTIKTTAPAEVPTAFGLYELADVVMLCAFAAEASRHLTRADEYKRHFLDKKELQGLDGYIEYPSEWKEIEDTSAQVLRAVAYQMRKLEGGGQ